MENKKLKFETITEPLTPKLAQARTERQFREFLTEKMDSFQMAEILNCLENDALKLINESGYIVIPYESIYQCTSCFVISTITGSCCISKAIQEALYYYGRFLILSQPNPWNNVNCASSQTEIEPRKKRSAVGWSW